MKLASQAYQKHKYVPLDTNKLHLLLFVRRNLKPILIKKTVSKKITKAKRMIRSSEDNVELIRKLGELKKAGIISNKEFQAKKKQLLDKI